MSERGDLDDLQALFDQATARPDPAAKARAVAQAMTHFDNLQDQSQGTAGQARLTSERPKAGLIRGVRAMFERLNNRAVLTGSTALAAVALVAIVPLMREAPPPVGGLSEAPDTVTPEPVVTVEVAPEAALPEPVIIVEEAAPITLEDVQAQAAPPTAKMRAADAPMVFSAAPPAPMLELGLPHRPPEANTETFPEADENPIKVTAEDPVSTFSIDVDTASWSVIRNSLNMGLLPPKDAVRIEEMVNYFTYDYPAPEGDAPFSTSVGVMDSPWRDGTRLVQIGLQGAGVRRSSSEAVAQDNVRRSSSEAVAQDNVRPPLNLVFLIDTSGSMSQPNKLPLLIQSFRLMLGQLSAEDSVAIVTYAGSAGRVLDPTPASDRDTILAALDQLQAGGGTAGQEGLQQAYATAREMAGEGEVSRVILATDGDFNIGISDPDALEDYIAKERDSGTYLSVLGFGRGNLDDATMQALAQTGNGMAAYIDTLAEAQKVLVDQLQGALFPIADDVKIQVEWNPAAVAEYRLIGYETRALRREEFNNDRVDAGEIGAGHQVTALYEITPVGSDARMTEPLRYAADAPVGDASELGFLRLRYKAPGADVSQLIETPILADAAPLPQGGWAAAVAGFGQILRGSDLIGDWSLGDAIALAQETRGEDRFGYRQEAVTLMRLAASMKN